MPDEVRRQVLAYLLRVCPYTLLPYEVLKGATFVDMFGSCLRQSRADPQQRFEIPDWGTRFRTAVEICEAAIAVHHLPTCSLDGPTLGVRAEMLRIETLLPETDLPFTFYIAGGFPVSVILGFGNFGDIDVWFAPKRCADGTWVVATASAWYPVSALMVNNAEAWIETFDLDICKCAIKCEVRGGVRQYQLVLTRACAVAFMLSAARLRRGVHQCLAQQGRLLKRLRKYRAKGVSISERDIDDISRTVADACEVPPCSSLPLSFFAPSMYLDWRIDVTGGYVNSVTLWPSSSSPEGSVVALPALICDPVILCPCHRSRSLQELALRREPWYVSALYSRAGMLLAIPGASRIDAACFQPRWLLERAALPCADIIADVRASLDRVAHNRREIYAIRCSWPGQMMYLLKDWRLVGDTGGADYMPQWMVYMSAGRDTAVYTHMFCVDTMELMQICHHAERRPLELF